MWVKPSTGGFAAITVEGVSLFAPPNGMNTLAAPMLPSNVSPMPFCEHTSSRLSSAFSAFA